MVSRVPFAWNRTLCVVQGYLPIQDNMSDRGGDSEMLEVQLSGRRHQWEPFGRSVCFCRFCTPNLPAHYFSQLVCKRDQWPDDAETLELELFRLFSATLSTTTWATVSISASSNVVVLSGIIHMLAFFSMQFQVLRLASRLI